MILSQGYNTICRCFATGHRRKYALSFSSFFISLEPVKTWISRTYRFSLIIISLLLLNISLANSQCIETQVTGHAYAVRFQNGIPNYNNILNSSDNTGARLDVDTDTIIIDLVDTISSGETYDIIWRKAPGEPGSTKVQLFESSDNSTWVENPSSKNPPLLTNSETYITATITANTETRYLRITNTDNKSFDIDAVEYTISVCLPDPDCQLCQDELYATGNGISASSSNVDHSD